MPRDEFQTTRERAYQLMSQGLVEIVEGDASSSDFETHEDPVSSSPLDPVRSTPLEPRNVGVLGQPSRSTQVGVFTSTPPLATQQMEPGGPAKIQAPDLETSKPVSASFTASSGRATAPRRSNTGSTKSSSKGKKGSARGKA